MGRIWLVLWNEIRVTVRRPSFLLTFLFPLIATLPFILLGMGQRAMELNLGERQAPRRQGYVDQSGLITSLPEDVPPDRLIPYLEEGAAYRALLSGAISAYFVIPANYVQSGEVVSVQMQFNPFEEDDGSQILRWVLLVNMLDGDVDLARSVWDPVEVETQDLASAGAPEEEDCSKPGRDCRSNLIVRYLPEMTMILLFGVIIVSSSLLLNSITDEKKNRTLEVLLSSISPQQMLTGKIIGLGILGLLETVIWGMALQFSLGMGRQAIVLPEDFRFPLATLVWGLVFFLLGYSIYASLMAALGALISDLKETSQATLLVTMPLLAGYLLILIVEDLQGALATAISLFPLTAPVTMIKRMVAVDVPPWQPPLAAGLMAITAVLVLRAVARMFHAQTLLSGQPFSAKRYYAALLGRG